jgi:hypothetical protein
MYTGRTASSFQVRPAWSLCFLLVCTPHMCSSRLPHRNVEDTVARAECLSLSTIVLLARNPQEQQLSPRPAMQPRSKWRLVDPEGLVFVFCLVVSRNRPGYSSYAFVEVEYLDGRMHTCHRPWCLSLTATSSVQGSPGRHVAYWKR